MSLPLPIADTTILSLLQQENKHQGWTCLYDKYAGILYGAILRITTDKKAAQNILKESFTSLKETSLITQTSQSFLVFLLHHTYRICKQELSAGDINRLEEKLYNSDKPLLNLFLFTPHSLQHVTHKTGLSEVEVKRKLHSEATQFLKHITEKNQVAQL